MASAHAEGDRERLREIEQAIEKRRQAQRALSAKDKKLAIDTARLRARLVAAARRVRDQEGAVDTLEARIIDLQRREADLHDALDTHRAQHDRVVAALVRLARRPVETFLLTPAPEIDRLRGATLLGAAVGSLEDQARTLRASLDSLAGVRTELDAQRLKLARVRDELDDERGRLTDLLNQKRQLRTRTAADQRALQKETTALAAKANDLRDLLRRLEARRKAQAALRAPPPAAAPKRPDAKPESPRTAAVLPPPKPGKPFSTARGALPLPARGRIVARYGESDGLGQTVKGIRIRTRTKARIVAAYDGQVAFAGPFRGYGLLLIIDHGEGYHSLMAGAAALDVVVGKWLLAGEPVGSMGPGKGKQRELYVELRHDGQPINPLPWMAAGKDKVSG
jgi:septal ring factor EnvC (AmiA/AmiB activator)